MRARYAYRTLATGTTTQYTDYCDIRTFVYHEAIKGDVNGDSEITIADINSLIDMVLAGVVVNARRADVNGDGEVNIADINAVINMILGA